MSRPLCRSSLQGPPGGGKEGSAGPWRRPVPTSCMPPPTRTQRPSESPLISARHPVVRDCPSGGWGRSRGHGELEDGAPWTGLGEPDAATEGTLHDQPAQVEAQPEPTPSPLAACVAALLEECLQLLG